MRWEKSFITNTGSQKTQTWKHRTQKCKTHTNFFEVYIGGKEVSNIRRESVTDAFLIAHLSPPPSFSPRNSFRRKTTFLPRAQEFLPFINNFLWRGCLPTFLWRDMCCLLLRTQNHKHRNTQILRNREKKAKTRNARIQNDIYSMIMRNHKQLSLDESCALGLDFSLVAQFSVYIFANTLALLNITIKVYQLTDLTPS